MLLRPSTFHDLVSGRRRGFLAALARGALRAAETVYAAAIAGRNARYDSGRAKVQRVPVPVISVGNLTLGGTGKTPLVEWIAHWLQQAGRRVAIVSRGYKATAGQPNDEALELQAKLPGIPHLQHPQRAIAANEAIDRFAADCLVLDDAFQHRGLHRDLDIVLLDALEPLGYEHVFPRGTLREPPSGLRRAGIVALSRADLLLPEARAALRQRIQPLAPGAIWAEVRHAPRQFLAADGSVQALASLQGASVAGFCGLGNPTGFRRTLENCGLRLVGFREFPDHHPYTAADLAELAAWAKSLDASALVCTQKDLVKIPAPRLGDRPLWALEIAIEFLAGQEAMEQALRDALGR